MLIGITVLSKTAQHHSHDRQLRMSIMIVLRSIQINPLVVFYIIYIYIYVSIFLGVTYITDTPRSQGLSTSCKRSRSPQAVGGIPGTGCAPANASCSAPASAHSLSRLPVSSSPWDKNGTGKWRAWDHNET